MITSGITCDICTKDRPSGYARPRQFMNDGALAKHKCRVHGIHAPKKRYCTITVSLGQDLLDKLAAIPGTRSSAIRTIVANHFKKVE